MRFIILWGVKRTGYCISHFIRLITHRMVMKTGYYTSLFSRLVIHSRVKKTQCIAASIIFTYQQTEKFTGLDVSPFIKLVTQELDAVPHPSSDS